jgi:CcmD family protein
LRSKTDGTTGRPPARWGGAVALLVAATSQTIGAVQSTSDFVPMTQAPQDVVPGGLLVVAAYAFAWVAVVAYLFVLWRKTQGIERELADVRARIGASPRGR